MASTTYHDSFGAFLKATDEKTVLADFVVEHIPGVQNLTLLDIGPGDGQVSGMILSRHPMRYVAVEMNPQLAGVVERSLGGEVIVDAYPTDVLGERRFDVVMSLYSLPIEVDVTERFVSRMTEQAAGGGLVLAATYDTHEDDWWKLRSELRELIDIESLRGFDEDSDQTEERNRRAHALLKEAGETSTGILTSRVSAGSIEEFFSAICFLLSAGEEAPLRRLEEEKEKILPALDAYQDNGRYRLDMHHTFFVTKVGRA